MPNDDLDYFADPQEPLSNPPAPAPKINYERPARPSSPPQSHVPPAAPAPPAPLPLESRGPYRPPSQPFGDTSRFDMIPNPNSQPITPPSSPLDQPITQHANNEPKKTPQSADTYVRALFAVIGIPYLIVFIGAYIPEIGRWSFYQQVAEQVAPVVGRWPFLPTYATPFHASAVTVAASLGLWLSIALIILIWMRADVAKSLSPFIAAGVAFMFVISALIGLAVGPVGKTIVGVLLCLLAAGLAGRTAMLAMSHTLEVKAPPQGLAISAAFAAGLTVLPALAVGRWATAGDVASAAQMSYNVTGDYLASWASVMQWITGVAIIASVAAVADVLFSIGRRSLVSPAIAAVVAIGAAVVFGGISSSQSSTLLTKVGYAASDSGFSSSRDAVIPPT